MDGISLEGVRFATARAQKMEYSDDGAREKKKNGELDRRVGPARLPERNGELKELQDFIWIKRHVPRRRRRRCRRCQGGGERMS